MREDPLTPLQKQAVEAAYIRSREKLEALARRLLAEEAGAAEECVQQTFLLACEYFERFSACAAPEAWLVETMKNTVYGYLRGTRRSQTLWMRLREESCEVDWRDGCVERLTYEAWLGRGVRRTLDAALTPRQRRVKAAFASGMTCREIAVRLGVGENAVRAERSRIRRRLLCALESL